MANARHAKAGRFVQQRLFSGLSTFGDLERRIADLPDEQSRGDAFEVFAEAYLATQLVHQAQEVWPGVTLPPSLQQRLRLPLKDMGVDGVFVTVSDETVCYQAKFRSGRPSLTRSELSTFFGLADVSARRLVFTNCDEIASVAEDRQGAIFVRGSDLDRLTADDFEVIETWLAGSVAPKKKKSPLPHQDAALKDILNGLGRHPRATALMACGSGKTLVALWTAERLNTRTVIVLLPSLALVRQTLHEWLHETNWPEVEYRCVCSDSTVQLEEDALVVRPSELDFPVTTQSADVRRFLERQTSAVRIVFSTYHSAAVVAEAVAGLPPFDFGVFDEAHKTAGREGMKFTLALNDGNLPIARRLFLTATPRHYDVAPKDKTGEGRIVLSMDVPEIYGPVVHRLPFSTAANLGIITDYKILISIVTSEMVTDELLRRGVVLVEGEEIKARQVANQVALQSAIQQQGVSRVFTFHSKVDAANSFTADGPEGIATHLPDFHCAHINGAMSVAHRKRLMDEFAAAPRAILSNARCLTEGVDVPAVDMVAFLSPRRSLVDIVQATGRAMRLSPGKKFGYVLVPLYVEKARGETIEEAVKRSDYDEVWNVLRQLQEHDDLLAQIISEMRMQRGETGGFDDTRFRERVLFLGPSVSLETLRSSITAACLDAIGEAWFERYGQLVAYYKERGNCDMPARWPKNQKLATWVVNQRVLRRDGALEDEKIALLDKLGFKWSPHASKWRTYYLALLDYRNEFGDCRVPQDWKRNKKLAQWVKTQRLQYARNKLGKERIAMLEKIGFEWFAGVSTWDDRFAELCAFKERFQHTRVRVKWSENPLLGQWAAEQRYKHRLGELRKEYEDRLNSIGFEWEVPRAIQPAIPWEKRLEALMQHKAEHGHLAVARRDKKYPGLAEWMTDQRARLKNKTLPDECKKQLDAIGFPWIPAPQNTDKQWSEMFTRFKEYAAIHGATTIRIVDEATAKEREGKLDSIGFEWQPNSRRWDQMFEALRQFHSEHQHCRVPAQWSENPKLASWVATQRARKAAGKLAPARIAALDGLGFTWRVDRTAGSSHAKPIKESKSPGNVQTPAQYWEAMFAALQQYKEANGDCLVPQKWKPNRRLAEWVSDQRMRYKRNQLAPDRVRRLREIGFDFDPIETKWQTMFQQLVEYQKENGDCNVPQRSKKYSALAGWVKNQRLARKMKRAIPAEHIKQLDQIGFIWAFTDRVSWDDMFAKLAEYKRVHGHCNVPQKAGENKKLGKWVNSQRTAYYRKKLSPERQRKLEEIGFVWNLRPNLAPAR